MTIPDYALAKTLPGTDMEAAVARVTEVLATEGFGVLSTIDVQATLKKKLDHVMGGYRILGACNPGLAKQAVASEPYVGLLLPCNVLVREVEGGTEVSAIAPKAMLAAAGGEGLDALAEDAEARLRRVIAAL